MIWPRGSGPGCSWNWSRRRTAGCAARRVQLTLPGPARGPRHYGDYRKLLAELAPTPGARARALDILHRLGTAEAEVHGVTLEQVHFHEISDWDSIADILLNAVLLDRIGITSASTAPLPLGAGRVRTEHGPMPVPAPATLALLRHLPVLDDGIAGERVTPTGAAIMAHLDPALQRPGGTLTVSHTGHGLGTRALPGCANLLRLTLLSAAQPPQGTRDRVTIVSFHVDDQTPEDLATALDNLRAREDVLDVLQSVAHGKKSRLTAQIQVLCHEATASEVIEACFRETTTIGLRVRVEERHLLPRSADRVAVTATEVRRKCVLRPDGSITVKPENDDISSAGDHAARTARRREALLAPAASTKEDLQP